jgi:beta-glucanase (GH16 family)
MKFALIFVLTVLGAGTPIPGMASESVENKHGWHLVWADEFNGNELDRTKWAPERSCWGGGNNERQCYTDRIRNICVLGGKLYILAYEEKFRGPDRPPEIESRPDAKRSQPYTSGKIRTLGLASWKYGKIEFRAKPPARQGTWPAVWMMSSDNHYGGWPRSGEIDILEGVNLGASCPECKGTVGENRMLSAIHFGDYATANKQQHTRVTLPTYALPSDDFHVWTLEWAKGLMRFYLDGRQYWELQSSDWETASPLAAGNADAPFDQPFYLMANLAIGGKLAEENNDKGLAKDVVPAAFAIDWIRVYQCAADRETGLRCMDRETEGE